MPSHATTLNGHKIVVIRGVRKQADMYFHLEREGMFMNTSFNVFMNAVFKGLGLVQRHKLTISLYIWGFPLHNLRCNHHMLKTNHSNTWSWQNPHEMWKTVTATGWKHVTEKHTLKKYCHRTRTFTSFWVGLG